MKSALPLPPFLPDQSANSGVLLRCDGVLPRPDGYGPIGAFLAISEALPDAFKGGASVIAEDGTSYLFVGTATTLQMYAAGAWTEMDDGFTITGQWRFAQFGNYAIAVNGSDTQVIDLTAGTTSTLTDAPAGVCVAIVGDHVVIGQDASDKLGIYTSGVNDHTDWDAVSGGATIQPMLAGGEVMGLAGGEYGVILQRERLVRMNLTGDADAPFTYDPITENVGCASKASVAAYGRTVFFLSDNGFMALDDGQALRPIGSEKVDQTFKGEVPKSEYENLFSAVDPQRKIVQWTVPGTPGKRWIYNYELDRWTTHMVNNDGVFSGFTSSQTLEEVAATYTDLDDMPYSLDHPIFSGGSPQFYAVQDGMVGSFSGDPVAAEFQMGWTEFAKGRIARFEAIRPVTDGIDGHTVTLELADRQGDAPVTRTVKTPLPETAKRGDWPRLVARKVNPLDGRISALEARFANFGDYADDAAAAAGGVGVGDFYHTSGDVKVRVA